MPAAAVVGTVVGHWLAYTLSVPNDRLRATLLAATGHNYWVDAVAAAVVLCGVAVASTVVQQFRSGLLALGQLGSQERLTRLWRRLALLQVGIFVVQEAIERKASAVPVSHLVADRTFRLGLLAQVAVALVVALALATLGRCAAAAGRALRAAWTPAPAPSAPRPWPSRTGRPSRLLVAGLGGRGPPRSCS